MQNGAAPGPPLGFSITAAPSRGVYTPLPAECQPTRGATLSGTTPFSTCSPENAAAGILTTHAAHDGDPHDLPRATDRQEPLPPQRLPGPSRPETERAGSHPRFVHTARRGSLPLLDGKVDAKPLLGQAPDRPIREHRSDGLVDPLDPGGHGRVIFPKGNSYLSLREVFGQLP